MNHSNFSMRCVFKKIKRSGRECELLMSPDLARSGTVWRNSGICRRRLRTTRSGRLCCFEAQHEQRERPAALFLSLEHRRLKP
jgi:hypothetical protein